jgi:hypothetical protein
MRCILWLTGDDDKGSEVMIGNRDSVLGLAVTVTLATAFNQLTKMVTEKLSSALCAEGARCEPDGVIADALD